MDEKISNKLLAIPIAISYSIIIVFVLFFLCLSKVDASSYYFDFPRNHRLCEGPFNNTIPCNGVTQSTIVNSANPNTQKGNYIIATYRYDQNINGVTGTSFKEGNYSLSFAGYFTTIEGTDVDKSLIKSKLLYYPSSSNDYAVATCDNSESFVITKGKMNTGVTLYKYSYSCETIQITSGKTFLGFQVYLDLPSTNLIEYIDYSVITTNLTLIGEGEATNNDIINNQNQNTDKIIGSIDDMHDSITDIDGFITSTDPADLSAFDDYAGWLPPGPIDSLLNLPLTLLNNLTNLFSNGQCETLDITLPYLNKDIEIPCLSTLYSQIDGLNIAINALFLPIVAYFAFKYLANLYTWIDTALKMQDTNYMSQWGGV